MTDDGPRRDGVRERDGGVEFRRATPREIEAYAQARAQLDALRVPVLLDSTDPHQRLYIAALDGTGNSMVNDNPENWSVVAKMYQQVRDLKYQGATHIAGGYVEGTFTQEGVLRTAERLRDGRFAHSFDARVETAYLQFCKQAKAWLQQDPDAKIRIAGVGFSRGAEQVAALLRMIDERGIRDPDGAVVALDRDNLVRDIRYADKPLLVAPRKTLQAALMVDPVATGVEDEDRRLPGSVLSTFEISAMHERRDAFRDNDHVPKGFSEDRRNLNVAVPGAHSDAGDTYARNGVGTLSINLGVAFINRLSDRPILTERALPADPSQYVIHRSDQHMFGMYTTRGFDRDGQRDVVVDQSPARGVQRKDPIRPEMDAQVERRTVPAVERARDARQADPQASRIDLLFDRLTQGALDRDARAMSATVGEFTRDPTWLAFQAEASRERLATDRFERQVALAPPSPDDLPHRPHAMRM